MPGLMFCQIYTQSYIPGHRWTNVGSCKANWIDKTHILVFVQQYGGLDDISSSKILDIDLSKKYCSFWVAGTFFETNESTGVLLFQKSKRNKRKPV